MPQSAPDQGLFQGSPEQQPRLLPIAPYRAFSDSEHFGALGLIEAGEIAHLHHLNQSRLNLAQLLERFMNT